MSDQWAVVEQRDLQWGCEPGVRLRQPDRPHAVAQRVVLVVLEGLPSAPYVLANVLTSAVTMTPRPPRGGRWFPLGCRLRRPR